MQLTLGPVLYHWTPERWREFYFRIADEAPVDTVVIGEAVCSKRTPFKQDHIPAVIERLEAAGKRVLHASLILVSLPRERRQTRELVQADEAEVEINDLTCLTGLTRKPFAVGPFVNVYNEAAAGFLAARGATRICLPPELPLPAIAVIAAAQPKVATEVFAFGKVPLAISARCYHARAHKLTKDNCRFVCEQDPDGMPVKTLDGAEFLSVNGVQTLSAGCASLLRDVPTLRHAGVASLRLSPQCCDMVAVARLFRDVVDERIDPGEAERRLGEIYPDVPFSNGFLYGAPGHVRMEVGGGSLGAMHRGPPVRGRMLS
ncbi:ubiquinone anaerobic biosynthesis protein UbiV [Bosea robiniae]|uniref:Ubiquinone biosynthesis protein UbiV n=1 Tax=Bosea robiniae TaxID=1036780 RepID=A0ABY0PA42_9HYPH|nr:U32 family peptidase [Bosea robiniae]SDH80778.1 Collagenase-like protease, PrtC family [Bosea robiniae]